MTCGCCSPLYRWVIGLQHGSSGKESFHVDSAGDLNPTDSPTPQPPPIRSPPIGPFEAKAKKSPKFKSGVTIREVYKIGSVLGSGGFATVREAMHRKNGVVFACKVMNLPPLGVIVPDTENSREDIFKEIEILSRLNHKNIVGLLEFYVDEKSVYLVSELLKGGELLDSVLDNPEGYSEDVARLCFQQLMEGIRYLHENGVAHRDLKLENLLLVKKDDISNIKITDFGLAKLTQTGQLMTVVGTPQYVAPEIICGIPGLSYSVAVDMWSAGVILFILLGGYPPFYAKSDAQLFNLIRNGRWDFDDPVWKSVSKTAKNLIASLLVVDPEKRLTAEQTLNHPWMRDRMPEAAPLPLTTEKMKDTVGKWRKAIRAVTALHKFKNAKNYDSVEEPNEGYTEV